MVCEGDDLRFHNNEHSVELHGCQHTKHGSWKLGDNRWRWLNPYTDLLWNATTEQTAVLTVLLDIWAASQKSNCCVALSGATVITWCQMKVAFLIPVCPVCLDFGRSLWNSRQVFFLPILAPKQRKFKSSFTGVYWDISAHKTLCLLLECTIN